MRAAALLMLPVLSICRSAAAEIHMNSRRALVVWVQAQPPVQLHISSCVC
jgi:hypothetical protein